MCQIVNQDRTISQSVLRTVMTQLLNFYRIRNQTHQSKNYCELPGRSRSYRKGLAKFNFTTSRGSTNDNGALKLKKKSPSSGRLKVKTTHAAWLAQGVAVCSFIAYFRVWDCVLIGERDLLLSFVGLFDCYDYSNLDLIILRALAVCFSWKSPKTQLLNLRHRLSSTSISWSSISRIIGLLSYSRIDFKWPSENNSMSVDCQISQFQRHDDVSSK